MFTSQFSDKTQAPIKQFTCSRINTRILSDFQDAARSTFLFQNINIKLTFANPLHGQTGCNLLVACAMARNPTTTGDSDLATGDGDGDGRQGFQIWRLGDNVAPFDGI